MYSHFPPITTYKHQKRRHILDAEAVTTFHDSLKSIETESVSLATSALKNGSNWQKNNKLSYFSLTGRSQTAHPGAGYKQVMPESLTIPYSSYVFPHTCPHCPMATLSVAPCSLDRNSLLIPSSNKPQRPKEFHSLFGQHLPIPIPNKTLTSHLTISSIVIGRGVQSTGY